VGSTLYDVLAMRSIALALPIVAVVLATHARADEPDASAPSSTPDPAAAPVPTPAPPVSPPVPVASVDEDLPLRFRDMLRLEASRAKASRYFNGTLSIIGGGGVVAAGVYSLTTAADGDSLRKDISYLIIGTGGLSVLSAVLGMFGQTPIERLYESYAPFADDHKYSAEQRLREGEEALRGMAASDESSRRINGITNIVVGAAIGGLAVFFAASSVFPDDDRIVLGTLTGVSALVAIGSGIGQLWFQRGPAELALEHWEAARGLRREAFTITPMISPTRSGAVGGVTLAF
jgi:hypothetical protein